MKVANTRLPEVSTSAFERNYGKAPRGRGSWAFCPAEHYDASDYLDRCKWFNGLYAEAKRKAREAFRGLTDCIVVCT